MVIKIGLIPVNSISCLRVLVKESLWCRLSFRHKRTLSGKLRSNSITLVESTMEVKLLYFEGCPSYQHALENLQAALQEKGITAKVEMLYLTDPQQAEPLYFLGSPTIQVNGIDLEGEQAMQAGAGYGCRVYMEDSKVHGWPSKERILHLLQAFV